MDTIRLPIIKGTPAEATLKELVESAKLKENWFANPNESSEAARGRTNIQADPAHASMTRHITLDVGSDLKETYHIAFTITVGHLMSQDGTNVRERLCRHATIATGDYERYVDPIEAFTLTRFLDFKELPQGIPHPDLKAIVFWELLPQEEEDALRVQEQTVP